MSSPSPSLRSSPEIRLAVVLGFSIVGASAAILVTPWATAQVPELALHRHELVPGTTFRAVTDDASTLILVGDHGTILAGRPGGNSWKAETAPSTAMLRAVAATSTLAIAVGEGGVILHRTMSTTAWVPEDSGTKNDLEAVAVIDGQFYAAGKNGVILRRERSRLVWKRMETGTTETLHAIASVDSHVQTVRGYAVGDHGTVLAFEADANDGTVPIGWHVHKTGITEDLFAVATKSELAVAVGAHGAAISSSVKPHEAIPTWSPWTREDTGTTLDLGTVAINTVSWQRKRHPSPFPMGRESIKAMARGGVRIARPVEAPGKWIASETTVGGGMWSGLSNIFVGDDGSVLLDTSARPWVAPAAPPTAPPSWGRFESTPDDD